MKIHEIISQDPIFKKYANKYANPFSKYQNPGYLPERIFKDFIKQADIYEIGLYYLGYATFKPHEIPAILASIERHKGFNIPLIDGILTEEYWKNFYINNYDEIMGQWKVFN